MAPTAKAARRPDKLDVEYEFRLAVEVDGLGAWEADVVATISHRRFVALGHTIEVLASASDRSRVFIDTDALPDAADSMQASARAAQSGDIAGAARALGFELADPPDEDP